MLAALALAVAIAAAPRPAAELFGGVYVHDVDTPLTKSGIEGGADVMLGFRGGRIGATPLQPYAFVASTPRATTNYAAARPVGEVRRRDLRPARPRPRGPHRLDGQFHELDGDKIAFGSRILFEPELGGRRAAQRPAERSRRAGST